MSFVSLYFYMCVCIYCLCVFALVCVCVDWRFAKRQPLCGEWSDQSVLSTLVSVHRPSGSGQQVDKDHGKSSETLPKHYTASLSISLSLTQTHYLNSTCVSGQVFLLPSVMILRLFTPCFHLCLCRNVIMDWM